LPKYPTIFGPGFFVGKINTGRYLRQHRWKACQVGRLCRFAAVAETGITTGSGTRQYLTIREGGAESLQGLSETAGLPKYHEIFGPGFFHAI
jgi:hypothetical protein